METHTTYYLHIPSIWAKATVTYLPHTHTHAHTFIFYTCRWPSLMLPECNFIVIQYSPLTKSTSQRSTKMFPICKKSQVSPHKYGSSGTHTQKQAHLLTPEYTVNTHGAGNASCRLHGLEMRNMIHFLSMLDSHALTQGWVQIHSSGARSWTWHACSPGQEKLMRRELASHTYCIHFKETTTVFYDIGLQGQIGACFM